MTRTMKNTLELFNEAEKLVRRNGFGEEIDWCDNRPSFDDVDERRFLTEYAWVVFNSGMSNRVIQAKWVLLTEAFHMFIPFMVSRFSKKVREKALSIFGNKRKVDAVITMAKKIVDEGFEKSMRRKIEHLTLDYLDSLPMIGEVTKYHLARNLGFDYVKPDRHLVKLASQYKLTPFELCYRIHRETGRRIGTIDVILWRYCEQRGQTKLVSEG